MTDIIVNFFREIIRNDYITIIIISILPIIELRGAIPVAIGMKMSPLMALITAYVGSCFVIPILLLLLRPILNALKKIKFISNLALSIEEIFTHKAQKVIEKARKKGREINGEISLKYKLLGVMAFVAVPLPMTGVWTGSAVAAFLDIKFLPALIVIMLGNLCAGIIMTLLSFFFMDYLDIILTVFLSIVVILLISYVITIIFKNMKKSKK